MAIIVHSFGDSYVFTDFFFNKFSDKPATVSRLTLSAHGTDGCVMVDGRRVNAIELWNIFNRLVDMNAIDYIRIASCSSAHGGSASFACRLSQIFHRVYVKGYKSVINSLAQPDKIQVAINQLGMAGASIILTDTLLKENFLKKNDQEFHSMLFCRGRLINERIFNPYVRC